MDHTPAGGKITISARVTGTNLHFSVADTGVGIPADQLDLIFERFYRADPSRARSTGGNGLGLSIVKQLVELHGGQVWAESTPGSGSIFHFTLPSARINNFSIASPPGF
jgi:signal transduction histidine kinase